MLSLSNSILLRGHIGRDPEIKETASGKKLARFSVATNKTYKNANGDYVKDTTWHNVIAWGFVADRVDKALKKGYHVLVQGSQINRNYEDQEGKKRYISEVVINTFERISKGKEENSGPKSGDNLPF